ncbi:MAG TPA: YbaK/EbsC family protein [Candidatus Methylomirabilis sp.]
MNPEPSTLNPADGAERVRAWMLERGVPGELIRPGDPTPTVESAAAALGVKSEQVIKSLLFFVDGSPYLVIVRGTARVNTSKLLQALGAREGRLGKKAEVEAITGFPVGGTPPFAHRQSVPILIDRGVSDLEEIYAGGGADDVMLRLRVTDLLQATQGRLTDVI